MAKQAVLIVDDEKNIRLTLSQTLESPDMEVDTAVNGEEALVKLQEKDFGLVLLDLKMPGMDGMDVLRWISENRPDVRVIIITAHGTVDSAVEAMKRGAVDYIQKPFVPKEIREIVSRVMDRRTLEAQTAQDYDGWMEMARKCVNERRFDVAAEYVRKAMRRDPSRAEAFNFLGALLEIQGDRVGAQKNYRAALSLDPTYTPAQENLYRSTKARPGGEVIFGGPGRTE
ncbi:MAG: response regulator receiver protein [Planctomycetes bacterium RBG_13_62_9]|nr:MAG: response regulator receiver protein [Planctomycetes bacterium RBG_13_62_9]